MVSRNEDQTIKLEMTIDRAELERQLNTVFQGPASADGAAAGGRKPGSKAKPIKVDPGQQMSKELKHMRRLAGIYFGVGALVKNSQVLNTTLGALGTVMGAVMDSFLAPLLPHLIPLLTKISSAIPVAADAGETLSEVITDLKGAGKSFGGASPLQQDKMIGQTLLASMRDLAIVMVPFSQKWGWKTQGEKNVEEVRSLGGEVSRFQRLVGTTSSLRKGTHDAAFGQDAGIGRMSPGLTKRMSGWSDEQLADFLKRNAVNITIQGNNTEEILATMRTELEAFRRDTSSSSSGAN